MVEKYCDKEMYPLEDLNALGGSDVMDALHIDRTSPNSLEDFGELDGLLSFEEKENELEKGVSKKPSTLHRQRVKRKFFYSPICCFMFSVVFFTCMVLSAIIQRSQAQLRLTRVVNTVIASSFIPQEDGTSIMQKPSQNSKNESFLESNSGTDDLIFDFTHTELVLLGTLYDIIANRNLTNFVEMLKGAHVILSHDNGWGYSTFKGLDSAYTRISSHESSVNQYGIPQGRFLCTLLIGRVKSKMSSTWFQLEGANWSPLTHPMESVIHILNYIEYKIRNIQIGPLGTSKYTEANPLIIEFPMNTTSSVLLL